jgi:two-component system response regulator DevR
MKTSAPEIHVLLVDDSALVREGVASVLRAQGAAHGIRVVGEAATVAAAIVAARQLRPHIVLLDLRLPDGPGYDACRAILRDRAETRVIVLTSSADDRMIYESISAGACGYLLKEIDPAGLVDAVRRAAAGEAILSPDLTARVLNLVRTPGGQSEPARLLATLSPQESRVLELVVAGLTNKEIAHRLDLSENTVKNYLGTVFEKLQVTRRSQAAALFAQRAPSTRPHA